MPVNGGDDTARQTQGKDFSDFVVDRATPHKIEC